MDTTLKKRKRKIIDIKPDTFHNLSILAASKGTNLKQFIENCLDELVEEYDDAVTYRQLCEDEPEGLEIVSEEESDAFLRELGL